MTDLLTAHASNQPDKLSRLDELPKTGSGKVLEPELRQRFWAGHGSNVCGSNV